MAVLTRIETPVGTIIASSDGQSLTGLWFEGQKYECAFVEECENGAERLFPRRKRCSFDRTDCIRGGNILPESRVGRVNRNPLSNRVDV